MDVRFGVVEDSLMVGRIIWLDLGYGQGSNFYFGGGFKDALLLDRTG